MATKKENRDPTSKMASEMEAKMNKAIESFGKSLDSSMEKVQKGNFGDKIAGVGEIVEAAGKLTKDAGAGLREFGPGLGEKFEQGMSAEGAKYGRFAAESFEAFGGFLGEMAEGAAEMAKYVPTGVGDGVGSVVEGAGKTVKLAGLGIANLREGNIGEAFHDFAGIPKELAKLTVDAASAVNIEAKAGIVGEAVEMGGELLREVGEAAVEVPGAAIEQFAQSVSASDEVAESPAEVVSRPDAPKVSGSAVQDDWRLDGEQQCGSESWREIDFGEGTSSGVDIGESSVCPVKTGADSDVSSSTGEGVRRTDATSGSSEQTGTPGAAASGRIANESTRVGNVHQDDPVESLEGDLGEYDGACGTPLVGTSDTAINSIEEQGTFTDCSEYEDSNWREVDVGGAPSYREHDMEDEPDHEDM